MKAAQVRAREPKLLDKIAKWIEHIRAHGVTDDQVHAALGMDVPRFLQLLEGDIDWLTTLARLRPGAMPHWVLYEVERLATEGWCQLRAPSAPADRRKA